MRRGINFSPREGNRGISETNHDAALSAVVESVNTLRGIAKLNIVSVTTLLTQVELQECGQ